MTRPILALPAALLALTACTPIPPTITAEQFTAETAELDRTAALPVTALIDMPTSGLTTYSGTIAAIGASDSLMGTLTMDVDFASSGITGAVQDLNYVKDGTPDQTLGGSLALTGAVSGNGMTANATGTLTAVDYGLKTKMNADIDLTGSFRNDTGIADVIAGDVTGSASGRFVNVDFDGGDFYVTAQ